MAQICFLLNKSNTTWINNLNSPWTTPLTRYAPALFVILWSTGFIGSRYAIPYAEPFTLTVVRMTLVVAMLTTLSLVTRAPWPSTRTGVLHIAIAGLLVHATYLSGVLFAIKLKLPLGFVAMIAGLQPVVTAVFAHILLGERLNVKQWCGMALGLLGVAFVILSKFSLSTTNWLGLAAAGVALVGITFGTLYQKRFCANMDLRTGGVIQYAATGIVLALLSLLTETREINWSIQFVLAISWLAIVLSIGAIGLLYFMISRGAASKVASLFFLTPAVTALMAFALFGEQLSWFGVLGLFVTAAGVALVMRGGNPAIAPSSTK
jgi:drug/metabolite transporter (DMT)-like permease